MPAADVPTRTATNTAIERGERGRWRSIALAGLTPGAVCEVRVYGAISTPRWWRSWGTGDCWRTVKKIPGAGAGWLLDWPDRENEGKSTIVDIRP